MTEAATRPAKACPVCRRPASPDYAPFCTKRCADVDLSRWFRGVYAVPAVENDDEPEDGAAEARDDL